MAQPTKIYNVYCDESNHLLISDSPVMALGAVYCPHEETKRISAKLREIKKKHGLSRKFETKWTKISDTKIAFYKDVIEFFFDEPALKFRGVVIPDKGELDHAQFGQTHDQFYYKMYYLLLQWIIGTRNQYHFYLDIKDTCGGEKTRKLQDILARKFGDFNKECISKVQLVRSHESELLQITDLLTGALTYANRGLTGSTAKLSIIDGINQRIPTRSLRVGTSFIYAKFNFLIWAPSQNDHA